ncbi:MAG: metallophosphoesterase [Nanoarchaeota archaeon]|nr:metallophosphoesterase [Nanoarchaeota archaeon]
MELLPGFRAVGCALLFEKTLVFSDLHLGYEKSMGVGVGFVSRFQFGEILAHIDSILASCGPLETIVLNGDIKHEFGSILDLEWRYVMRFLEHLQKHAKKVVLIKGNHDKLLKPIADKAKLALEPFIVLGEALVTHGDEITPEIEAASKKASAIIIGHEHPAVTLRKGARTETFKCFLVGKWKRKRLIVLPAMNPLTQGSDILSGERLSPFLSGSLSQFQTFLVGEEKIYNFGTVGKLAERYQRR